MHSLAGPQHLSSGSRYLRVELPRQANPGRSRHQHRCPTGSGTLPQDGLHVNKSPSSARMSWPARTTCTDLPEPPTAASTFSIPKSPAHKPTNQQRRSTCLWHAVMVIDGSENCSLSVSSLNASEESPPGQATVRNFCLSTDMHHRPGCTHGLAPHDSKLGGIPFVYSVYPGTLP